MSASVLAPNQADAQRTPAPAGIEVTGTAAAATLIWKPVTGAVSYSIKRWKQDDVRCCNNSVTGLTKTGWTDTGSANEGFPLPGIYVFEVTAVMDDRTTGATLVTWTRPDPAPVLTRVPIIAKSIQPMNLPAPTGITVRNDPTALVFNWQPAGGTTGVQIDAAPSTAGPWSPVSPSPVSGGQFVYTPVAGTLLYYRFSSALSMAVSSGSTIVPFSYTLPLNPLGVSAAQSGSNITVSWNPVTGASGYTVIATPYTTTAPAPLQVGGMATSATFVGLIPPGLTANTSYMPTVVKVTAQFPPQGISGASILGTGIGVLSVYDPSLCWPAAGELPGGPVQNIPPPATTAATVTFSWPMSGQVFAYRVDRAPAGSTNWESVACIRPLTTLDFDRFLRLSSTSTVFEDQSTAIRPSTTYQYRFTAIGAPDVSGKRLTSQNIVMATTAGPETLVVGATASAAGAATSYVRLSWPVVPGSTARFYLITSSYGYRSNLGQKEQGNIQTVYGVPRGAHSFSVTPIYRNGVAAATTTVTVVVP